MCVCFMTVCSDVMTVCSCFMTVCSDLLVLCSCFMTVCFCCMTVCSDTMTMSEGELNRDVIIIIGEYYADLVESDPKYRPKYDRN